MTPEEYAACDGLGLADLVRRGEVTRTELIDLAIDIAERRDPEINAIAHRAYDYARAEAAERDAQRGGHGAFDGVPFLLKDLRGEIEGWPLEMGSRALIGNVSRETNTVTKRQLDAGLIPFAKTTTPEFGLIAVTESKRYGDTRNPWNLERTPGASSGGSAAAVAAGIAPIGHANDGGGSIRIPASCTGLVGMKPSRGRMPVGPRAAEVAFGLGIDHVVTRTVRDSAAVLDLTCGGDQGAAHPSLPRDASFLESVWKPLDPLRVAFWTKYWQDDQLTHPECVAAVESAAALLAELGHTVEEKRPAIDFAAMSDSFMKIWCSLAGSGVASITDDPTTELFEASTLAFAEMSRRVTGAELVAAREHVLSIGRDMGDFHTDHDILVTTVLGTPPIGIGEWSRVPGEGDPAIPQSFMLTSSIANATGQPSVSLPLHMTADGLPVGVMITAGFGREDLLYQVAGELERAAPWIHRQPPCWA